MFEFLSSMKKPLVLWASVTLFFAFQFVLRLSPGILMDDIMIKYHIDTVTFGSLMGSYYLIYSLMQIPLGILLDKFNFRYVTVCAILVAVLGNATFIFSDNLSCIFLGRYMIGAGSAVGFLSVVKVIKTFFEEKYQSFMIGLSFTFGLTGAIVGAKPMKMLMDHFGYSEILTILCFIGIAIAAVILIVRHEDIASVSDETANSSISMNDILKVFLNPKILLIGFSGGLLVGFLEGFSDLWGFALFAQIYNFSELDSKFLTSVIFIGMCFGGPILAYFSYLAKSYTKIIILSAILMILVFVILFGGFQLSYDKLFMLMFFLGILCCYQVLVFSLTGVMVDKSIAGIAIAVVNCLNMSFGYIFHNLLAYLMESKWHGNLSESGGRLYDYDAFLYSLSVIPIAAVVGMFGFIYFLKHEKYSR